MTDVNAIQFNNLDDYWRILQWMKDAGDTSALADEVRYMTPIMLIKTATGTAAVRPGEYVIRKPDGTFDSGPCPYWPPCVRCQPRTFGARTHVRPADTEADDGSADDLPGMWDHSDYTGGETDQ